MLIAMRTAHGLALLLAAGLIASPFADSFAVRTQRKQAQDAVSQFRIRFGVADKTSKEFKGRIRAEGGKVENLRGWRFSEQDRAAPDGTFDFRTKRGSLENQLDTSHSFGETELNDPRSERLIPEGILFVVRGRGVRILVSTSQGSFEFNADHVQYGRPRAALNADVLIERLPVEMPVSGAGAADDFPAVTIGPDGERWVCWISYENGADRVMVRNGTKLHAITGRGDHHAPTIAYDGTDVWVAWTENVSGVFHLFVRKYADGEWTPPERLSSAGGWNLWPDIASDGHRNVAVVWQGFRGNESAVLARLWDGKRWSAERRLGQGSSWMPRVAFGGAKLWVAWDSYATGAYQIFAQEWKGTAERVSSGDQFAAHASVVVDSAGRPVVAWEESDSHWGKDFAFPVERQGTPLYKSRRIRVVYRDSRGWKELPGPVADAVPADVRRYVQQPRLAMDGSGRLFLAMRARTSAAAVRVDNWATSGVWETFLTYRSGSRWQPAIVMPSSTGRNSMAVALAVRGNSVHCVWASDGREQPGALAGELDVYAAEFSASMAATGRVRGGTAIQESSEATTLPAGEMADVQRVRAYRYNLNGKVYRILRGDLHRHTELSRDGAGDGSIDDTYRYALDAAALDFVLISDHQMGVDQEYNWWLTQKSNDLYFVAQRFVPLYGYERTVPYPNGQRIVMWPERGEKVLRVSDAEARGTEDSGRVLFPYLRDTNGISAAQAAATDAGTDWRNAEQSLEPLAEIYEAYAYSFEHEGAPRAQKSGDIPVHGDVRPAGYLWNAWAKGYRLGVEAGSGHVATHTAYTCVIAEEFTRQGLLDAMKRRHVYAATDNIVLDFRISTPEGTYLMGDAFDSKSLPRVFVRTLGTAPIAKIHIIRNGQYIHVFEARTREVSMEFMDNGAQPGMNYYYVRVEQTDGEIAWSSPIWIRN
jgi:hypothetical protein